MRIAIIGAGFAGLATAWYLIVHSKSSHSIDIFDSVGIGKGVSGLSSGLLHPYSGKHAKKTKDAAAQMDHVHALIYEAARALNQPLIISKGILRPTVHDSQVDDFKKCAQDNPETKWWNRQECEEKVPGLKVPLEKGGGLFIPHGLTLNVPQYLEGLMQACALFGTQFYEKSITDLKELSRYDRVIFALGAGMKKIAPFSHLPIEAIKGQVLTLKWPKITPPLPFSIVSEGYLAMNKEQTQCFAGATFEREFETVAAEIEFAKKDVYTKLSPLFPKIREMEIINCQAGVRAASSRDHRPMVGKISEKWWFITGLGGKGLLYHGWLGSQLAQAVLRDDPILISGDFRYPRG